MKYLTILLTLVFLSGCMGTLPEPGLVTSDSKPVASEDSKPAPEPEPKKKYDAGMNPVVGALLGVGAMSMMLSIVGMTVDEGSDHPEFAIIAGGTGLVFWGAAGIYYLAEVHDDEEEKK